MSKVPTALLRWPGAKRWLAAPLVNEIVECRPDRYVEPFLGGGSVALLFAQRDGVPLVLNDASAPLMNTWRMVVRYPEAVSVETAKYLREYGNRKDGYERAREAFNRMRPAGVSSAALMLYLNLVGYNGLWRENSAGKLNVPFGDVKNPTPLTVEECLGISTLLGNNVKLRCEDALATLAEAGRGDAVYADPPYDEGFVAYTARGFSTRQQEALAEALRAACERGARVWATNADTPRVRSLYSWASVEVLVEPRRIAPKASREAACVLIRG
jgi:DNA adenine methylase